MVVKRHGDNQWILKLTSHSDLENILAKKDHVLEGSLMSVQLYDEREAKERLDPHRFILSGFSEDCKCSHLSVFIKSCSRGAEHSWEILNDGQRIAVTFKQDIEVWERIKDKCLSLNLKTARVSFVRAKNTIVVLGQKNDVKKLRGVSGAILKAAGKSVVDDCAKLGTQKEDGVVVTGGGNLKCKHIIQMVGPTTTAGITTSTERVLQLCESKSITSMAIPAIGTGKSNINPEESIKAILKGLQKHLSQTTSTSIKFIFIVAFEQKVFDSFRHHFAERNQQSQQRTEVKIFILI
ncbi:hypothetical protein ANANG_G00067030 [Anguilla anguilla]|uniref:Macro domain-containing protein n=1 Tax=Anguilla anguilla TaxID=7936 RepID=A0A9D3MS38_ANGAN|nr:hypothetical protein ANANG_G00067030 [Anguilla anguilla]